MCSMGSRISKGHVCFRLECVVNCLNDTIVHTTALSFTDEEVLMKICYIGIVLHVCGTAL